MIGGLVEPTSPGFLPSTSRRDFQLNFIYIKPNRTEQPKVARLPRFLSHLYSVCAEYLERNMRHVLQGSTGWRQAFLGSSELSEEWSRGLPSSSFLLWKSCLEVALAQRPKWRKVRRRLTRTTPLAKEERPVILCGTRLVAEANLEGKCSDIFLQPIIGVARPRVVDDELELDERAASVVYLAGAPCISYNPSLHKKLF